MGLLDKRPVEKLYKALKYKTVGANKKVLYALKTKKARYMHHYLDAVKIGELKIISNFYSLKTFSWQSQHKRDTTSALKLQRFS